jgi:hypothetical protein
VPKPANPSPTRVEADKLQIVQPAYFGTAQHCTHCKAQAMDPPGQDRLGWAGQDPEKPSSLPAHFRFQLELHPVLDPCPRAQGPPSTVFVFAPCSSAQRRRLFSP